MEYKESTMIIQIDDNYFNPLQITHLIKDDNNVRVYFSDSTKQAFKNWNITDLAAEINRCIEEFHK